MATLGRSKAPLAPLRMQTLRRGFFTASLDGRIDRAVLLNGFYAWKRNAEAYSFLARFVHYYVFLVGAALNAFCSVLSTFTRDAVPPGGIMVEKRPACEVSRLVIHVNCWKAVAWSL